LLLAYTAAFGLRCPDLPRTIQKRSLGYTSEIILPRGVLPDAVGIVFAVTAGLSKEKETVPRTKTRLSINEFRPAKDAGSHFLWSDERMFRLWSGRTAGASHQGMTIQHGTPPLWQGLPVTGRCLVGDLPPNFKSGLFASQYPHRPGYQSLNSISFNRLSGPPLEPSPTPRGRDGEVPAILGKAHPTTPDADDYIFVGNRRESLGTCVLSSTPGVETKNGGH